MQNFKKNQDVETHELTKFCKTYLLKEHLPVHLMTIKVMKPMLHYFYKQKLCRL